MTDWTLKGFISLLGSHRSGTTWLGNALEKASDIRYWSEPRHIWVWGNWFRDNDVLNERHATRLIRSVIRHRFETAARKDGCRYICEKTPSNCFRVRFVDAVFPKAKFVLILRDGRAVIRSTAQIKRGGATWNRIGERLREVRPWDYPAFLSRLPWLWSRLRGRPLDFWGPRPPGWRQWLRNDHPDEVLAKQWAVTISTAFEDLASLDSNRSLTIRYEDLVERPREEIRRLVDFLELPDAGETVNYVEKTVRTEGLSPWRNELSLGTLERVRPILEPVLKRAGYEW